MNPLDLVSDWHNKFRVALPQVPDLDALVCSLRCNLLIEEKDELLEAIANNDRVEMLDALCDLQYVLSGAVLHFGIRRRFEFVHDSMRGYKGTPPRDASLNLQMELTMLTALINMKINSLAWWCGSADVAQVSKTLAELQHILRALIARANFPRFDSAFNAVHENNMQKLWDGSDMSANCDELGFEQADWKPGWFIAKNRAGKVQKPPGFIKVDLSPFVD
jgi:phosphoribosyl-ATP pyrophosphohydrolase